MSYSYEAKKYSSHCKCGARLLVPTWKHCQKCDPSTPQRRYKMIKENQKTLGPKIFNRAKYTFWVGDMEIDIPFKDYLKAEIVIYDPETMKIIGWK